LYCGVDAAQRAMTGSAGTEEVTSLLTAVLINRSVADVDHLLAGLPHPDAAVDADGVTALMLAAKNANMALVELLLRHGASVNLAETARRRTPIMFAVKTGNHELVDRLAVSSSELSVLHGVLKGNCSKNFLLQNIFGFHVYITNIYVKLSTEMVIMQKNNFDDNSILCYK